MSAMDLTQSQSDGIRIRVPRFAAVFLPLRVPLGCSARLDAMESMGSAQGQSLNICSSELAGTAPSALPGPR